MAKKYECEDCNRKFLYAATKAITSTIGGQPDYSTNAVPKDEEYESTEYRCCPYCGSLDFDEIAETEKQIVSVKSVPLEEVDELLKQGYEVENLYSKNAVLVKKESPEVIDCGTTTLEAAKE